jgi:hypothetical protein
MTGAVEVRKATFTPSRDMNVAFLTPERGRWV